MSNLIVTPAVENTPAMNVFNADSIGELVPSEGVIDYAFEPKDFPLVLARVPFTTGIEFSKTMRINYKCVSSAYKDRLKGKTFSIPFYSLAYLLNSEGKSCIDLYGSRKEHENAMRFTDSITVLEQAVAKPTSGPAPLTGKMYSYNRLQGYGAYTIARAAKTSYIECRDAILKTAPIEGQEKNYLRVLTCDASPVEYFDIDAV